MITVTKRRHFGQGIYRIKKIGFKDMVQLFLDIYSLKAKILKNEVQLFVVQTENSENRGQEFTG